MTIAVGVACPEGLVLGADSRSSLIGESYFRIVSDSAHKVFDIGGRFGAATFGWAFIEGNTIAGAIEEFAAQTKLRGGIDDVTEKLRDFFRTRIERHVKEGFDQAPAEGVDVLGFIVGGYDSSGIGHLKLLYLPSGRVVDGATTAAGNVGAHWQGETDVFVRLLKGFDGDRVDISTWPQEHQDQLTGFEYLIPFFTMTLQDAVDFATFMIRTTVDMQRFSHGTLADPNALPTCGGPIEILAVTGRGLEWIQHARLRTGSRPGRAEGSLEQPTG
jgi:hypothetical protein